MSLYRKILDEKAIFNKLISVSNEEFDNNDFSKTFPKMILRIYFKLSDEEIDNAVSNLGSNDEGLDAFFVDDKEKKCYFIQFKSKNNYNENNNKDAKKEWFSLLRDCKNKLINKDFKSRNKRIMNIKEELEYDYLDYYIESRIFHLGHSSEEIINNNNDIIYHNMEDILDNFVKYDEYDIEENNIENFIIEVKSNDFKKKNNNDRNYIFLTPKAVVNGNIKKTIVFTLNGNQVVDLLKYGTTIFERNVRGFLGENHSINKEIIKTAIETPEKFYYFNNGITITCESFKNNSLLNPEITIDLKYPQIINGAQTVNSIDIAYKKLEKKLKDKNKLIDHFEKLIILCKVVESNKGENTELNKEITRYNNSQNKIKLSDFYANRQEQKYLAEIFDKYLITYDRKRGILKNKDKHNDYINIETFAEHYYAQFYDPFTAKASEIFNNEDNENSKYYEIFKNKSYILENKYDYIQAYYVYNFCYNLLKKLKKYLNIVEDLNNKSIEDKKLFLSDKENYLFFNITGSKSKIEDFLIHNKNYKEDENLSINYLDNFELKLFIYIISQLIDNSYFKNDDLDKTIRIKEIFKNGIEDKSEIKRILTKISKNGIKIYFKILKKYKTETGVKFKKNLEHKRDFIDQVKDMTSDDSNYTSWEF